MNFSSVSGKSWIFKKFNSSDVLKFSENYSITEIVAKLISIRIKHIADVNSYLNPKIKDLLPNPFNLKDMRNAVNRVYESIINRENIGIFGDYDVDGATSTAILTKYFSLIRHNVNTYIPDRHKEGYGPTKEGFDKLIKLDSKLIFTVDCGTLSFDPINFAKDKNVDVIVLDHHQSDTKLPKALAIINPNIYYDESELKYLCADGVCFVF